MINKNFLRIWMVFERMLEDTLQRWYGRVREGLVQGVSVDFQNARVKIPCEMLEHGEVVPWVKTTEKPSWFQISLMVPGPNWLGIVGEGKKIAPHLDQKSGRWLLKFRNGTVVRFYGRKLVADYLAVARQNSKWFLVQKERVAMDIPYHIKDREALKLFLGNEVEADIVEAAVELFNPNALPNQQWQKGLQEAVKVAPPQQKPKVQVKPQQPHLQPQPQPKPQPQQQLSQAEPEPKPQQPVHDHEEVEVFLPPVAPQPQKSPKKKFEVAQKERPPKRKRPPVEADDEVEKEIQLARKGNWRDLLN